MTSLPPFWTLVESTSPQLLAYARRLVGDSAEDVVQDAFLKALASYPRLTHSENLRAWLFRITTTCAYDHSGRRNGRAEVLTAAVPARADQPKLYDDAFEILIESLSEASRDACRCSGSSMTFPTSISAGGFGSLPRPRVRRVSTAVQSLRRQMK